MEGSSISGRTRHTSLEPSYPRRHKTDKGNQSTDQVRGTTTIFPIGENIFEEERVHFPHAEDQLLNTAQLRLPFNEKY